jgi:hypothetical protein
MKIDKVDENYKHYMIGGMGFSLSWKPADIKD